MSSDRTNTENTAQQLANAAHVALIAEVTASAVERAFRQVLPKPMNDKGCGIINQNDSQMKQYLPEISIHNWSNSSIPSVEIGSSMTAVGVTVGGSIAKPIESCHQSSKQPNRSPLSSVPLDVPIEQSGPSALDARKAGKLTPQQDTNEHSQPQRKNEDQPLLPEMSESAGPEALMQVLAGVAACDSSVDEDDFEQSFGPDVANGLRAIGCRRVESTNGGIKLTMDGPRSHRHSIGVWDEVQVGREVTFKVSRSGDKIVISDVQGVRLHADSRYTPDKDCPDLVFSPGLISLKNWPGSVNVPRHVYDNVDRMLRKMGK